MKTLVLCGKTATGKTTLAKALEKHFGMRRMVTYTTRAPRPGEKDGVDYNFLTREEFDRRRSEGFFAETADWNAKEGVRSYGSAAQDYKDPAAFAVLDPNGIRRLKEKGVPITVILLEAEDKVIGIKNLSQKTWRAKMPDGQFYNVLPGKGFPLWGGIVVDFGGVTARINEDEEGEK